MNDINTSTHTNKTPFDASTAAIAMNQAASTQSSTNITTATGTGTASELFSPILTDTSMAILSPPSSRYAFDPNESGSNTTSVLSPLLATVASPPISELNFASLNIISSPPPGYGTENDIPAFLPKTEMLLENFTSDLKIFNNWIQHLNIEEKKTAIGLFLDSNTDEELTDFIKDKIEGTRTSHLSSAVRPLSPIIPIANGHLKNVMPITLDSILNMSDNDNDNDTIYNPTPNRVLSPAAPAPSHNHNQFSNNLMKEQIERPKSAGQFINNGSGYSRHHYPQNPHQFYQPQGQQPQQQQVSHQQYITAGCNSPMRASPMLEMQPLHRVFSDGGGGASSSSGHHRDDMIGMKLQQSLNTINNRNMIDSNKEDNRGRQRFLHPSGSGSTLNGNANANGLNYMSNHYGHLALKGLTQSSSVPPNNRIRTNRGVVSNGGAPINGNMNIQLNGATNNKFAKHLYQHGYSKSGSNLANLVHTSDSLNEKTGTSNSNAGTVTSVNKDIASDELLADIPAWLKALRLHKYTPNLQHLRWEEMVYLSDDELDKLGVTTVGARNKLMKSFAYVKEKRGLVE